jgi:hypothetical protein
MISLLIASLVLSALTGFSCYWLGRWKERAEWTAPRREFHL